MLQLQYTKSISNSSNDLRNYFVNENNSKKSELITYKPMSSFENNQYYTLKLNNIEIKADAKLACIIIFYDYLNENLFLKENLNCYDNDFFYEVIAPLINLPPDWNYSMINNENIFNRPDIDMIIEYYIKEAFENDTLWFEEN